MHILGLDIGTTTVCAAAFEKETGKVLKAVTLKNNSFIPSCSSFEKIQNPDIILELIKKALKEITEEYNDIEAIGVTGQMHGIVYCSENGEHLSPLYIWQDGRGNEKYKDGLSYSDYITRYTSYKVASGYGLVTHFYNTVNALVPEGAHKVCTIHDYIVMRLCGLKEPLMHSSDAASLGLYNLRENCFDYSAISSLGICTSVLPEVTAKTVFAGKTAADFIEKGIPVTVAIGDNQASFLGSVTCPEETILVNMGTGSQVSVMTAKPEVLPVGETRPFLEDSYLFVGSSLCGGRAYQLLEGFFRECGIMLGLDIPETESLYPIMDKLSENAFSESDKLNVCCEFCGTRENPDSRGSIDNIGTDNFTPAHLICGVLQGAVNELYEMYDKCRPLLTVKPIRLVGSGNGIRKSRIWQRLFEEKFGMSLTIPPNKEEAASGACVFAMKALLNQVGGI